MQVKLFVGLAMSCFKGLEQNSQLVAQLPYVGSEGMVQHMQAQRAHKDGCTQGATELVGFTSFTDRSGRLLLDG